MQNPPAEYEYECQIDEEFAALHDIAKFTFLEPLTRDKGAFQSH